MLELILWVLGVTSFTLFGAWYARRFDKPDALIGLYVLFVAISQITAAKIARPETPMRSVATAARRSSESRSSRLSCCCWSRFPSTPGR